MGEGPIGEAAGADAETDSDGNSGGANDTIRSLSVEAVSKAIAQAGGVGIARQIIQQIEQQSRQTEPADESAVIKSAGTKVS